MKTQLQLYGKHKIKQIKKCEETKLSVWFTENKAYMYILFSINLKNMVFYYAKYELFCENPYTYTVLHCQFMYQYVCLCGFNTV